MWRKFVKKLWKINVELELDLIKLSLLYMGGGNYGLPYQLQSLIAEFGHMGTNYHQDQENTSKTLCR